LSQITSFRLTMGRQKRGHNAEARKSAKGKLVDQEEVRKLRETVLPASQNEAADDEANALVLPAKKRRFKKDKDASAQTKLLSRKRRRRLEKIVDEKRKKGERAELLQKLEEVQASKEVMDKMTSIASVQTKGVKRHLAEEQLRKEVENEEGENALELLALENPVKRRKLGKLLPKPKVYPKRNDVLGFDESSSSSEDDHEEEDVKEEIVEEIKEEVIEDEPKSEPNAKPEPPPPPPKGHPLSIPQVKDRVFIKRNDKLCASRDKLPIVAEEQAIVEAINENPTVILAGETGSGKTTQVPQFLYEAGYACNGKLIGVTEPRRVAAMAMSKRVGEELNLPEKVSYQIRFEGNVTPQTRIKFMTDGVLLREMSKDFRLSKYSVIIVDEAHERSVFTDILLGNLSRIVPMRAKDEVNGPLRLVIMSATLRVEDFTKNDRLFKIQKPPCLKVESRQYDVTCHFQRVTPDDYLSAALKKTCKIHKELPEGGILVFLTGQGEVNQMVRKLRKLFPSKKHMKGNDDEEEESVEKSMIKALKKSRKKNNVRVSADVDLDRYRAVPLDDTESDALRDAEEDEDLDQLEGDDDLIGGDALVGCQPMWTLPLYSLLNSDRQKEIFQPPPPGHRLCVVATNVAETSLTIPAVKYVVDTGKVKDKFYDHLTGVSTFQVTWTSKASAAQRAGRAGRQGPGHCYRLFSSEVYKNDFREHAQPDILKRPADDLVLQMKVKMVHFPPFCLPFCVCRPCG